MMRSCRLTVWSAVTLIATSSAVVASEVSLEGRLLALNAPATQKYVVVESEINDLFADAAGSCGIKGGARDKLQKKHPVPPEVRNDLRSELALTVPKLESTYVRPLLHQVFMNDAVYLVRGATSYNSLDPLTLVDVNSNNYLYTLDCSGYLTSAISAKIGLGIADAEAAASTAATAQWALLIARARLWSPIAHAIRPLDAPIRERYTTLQRLDTLWALNSLFPAAPDTDTIRVPAFSDFLWTSRSGNSSFQGKVNLSTSASYGFGFGSVSGKLDTGASFARGSRFSSFTSYPLSSADAPTVLIVPLDEVRRDIRDFVAQAGTTTNTVDSTIRVTAALPRGLCEAGLHWVVTDGKASPLPGSVVAAMSEGGCVLTVTPDRAQPDALQQLQKAGFGFLSSTENVGAAPLRMQVSLVSR